MQTDFNSLQCFPGNCGSASHDDVFARLGHVHTDHRVFEDGPLRQVLCLRLSIPVDGRQGMAERGCASLRLHLRDETVYGIQITGNVEFALVQIEAIAEWLRKRQYDESAFAIYERELAQLINPDLASAACSVWLERNATIDPVFGLPLNMSAKVYLATLNA